jgi:hypothetical protein
VLGLVLLGGAAPVVAGAQTLAASGKVSATAEAVCILRAIAAKHEDPKVRNPDYLAEKFVNTLDAALRPDGGGLYGARSAAAYVASVGEPLVTGWSQSQAGALVTREGLAVVSDLGPRELTARYLIGSDGEPDGMMSEATRIIHVRVP